MADTVICSVCGETNPADMEFCRNCQSRLAPLTGPLKGADAPIQPGEPPTRKVTSELEPLLPQWLREARQQARDSMADEQSKPEPPPSPAPPGTGDLLAGLESQGTEEEDEIPDWLAHITGGTTRRKQPAPEESQAKWVELGHTEPATDLPTVPSSPASTAPQSPASADDELRDWFKQAGASSESADFRLPPASPTEEQAAPAEEPSAEQPLFSESQGLDWLRNLDAATPAPSEAQPPAREEAPDWLKKLQADQAPQEPERPPEPAAQLPDVEMPDWLSRLEASQAPQNEPASPAEPAAPIFEGDVPDWLKTFRQPQPEPPAEPIAPAPAESEPPPAASIPTEAAVPDWLKAFDQEVPASAEPASPPATPEPPTFEADVPDWARPFGAEPAAAGEGGAPAEPASPLDMALPDWLGATDVSAEPAPDASAPGPLPGWLSSLGGAEAPSGPAALEADGEPAGAQPDELEPASPSAAFTEEGLSSGEVDAIFASMQTPDWLSSIAPEAPSAEDRPPGADQEQPIGPAELPSWVQAMRPVEATAPAPAEEPGSPVEDKGPFAGLQGILPAFPGAELASSKPRPHSIKLIASEQQQAHAALLEQILAAETSPVPLRTGAVIKSAPVLRWAIALVLLLVVGAILLSGSAIFAAPAAVPVETIGAIEAVQGLAPDAPVLLIFDYQPATVGEMEASGGSLIENLILLKHPRLALLSTSPTGAALAERFMASALPDLKRAYARDVDYSDLGYLPGGLAGIYNFAQSPSAAMPLDANLRPVWRTGLVGPGTRLSDFQAVILLTDSAEAGRSWIEQTSSVRGGTALIIVSSAQAGPLLLPYVDSGQVNGMVSGLYGAAGTEQANAGLPGTVRRYWDAYSLGLYLAVVLIILGGLWNARLGMRDRSEEALS